MALSSIFLYAARQMRAFLALLKKVLRRGEQELRFVFCVRSLDAETDRRLYSIALDLEKSLRSRIESTLSSENVRLTRIEIRPGSVELRITFLAAYEFVAKHEDLERNSSQMIEKISTVIKAIFSEAGIHDLCFVSPLSEG
jgi:hypothetical protein